MTSLEKKLHNSNGTYLSEEVIFEILLYLNAKDLQSFKSVSKLWCSLISHPNFVKAHFNFNLIPTQRKQLEKEILFQTKRFCVDEYHHYSLINLQKDDDVVKAKELVLPSYIHNQQDLSLEASCDGLLLFHDKNQVRQQLYISNPVTARFERLPLIPFDCCRWEYGINSDCLRCRWALVHDTRVDRYKVFGIMNKFQYVVLTLGGSRRKPLDSSNSWKAQTIRKYEHMNFRVVCPQIILIQKELQWLTEVKDLTDYGKNQNKWYCISSLNIETLEFSETEVPPHIAQPLISPFYESKRENHLLMEVKGLLCLLTISHHQLQMFVLEDKFRCVWTKSQIVLLECLRNLPSFYDSFLAEDTSLVAMRGVDSSNLLDLMQILIQHGNELVVYKLKNRELRSLGFLREEHMLRPQHFSHSNSLVSWD